MHSYELTPSAPLRPYIRLIWLLELDQPAEFGPPERISPDGLLEAVFHYGTPFACRYADEDFARQPRSVVVSQTRRFVEIRPDGPAGLLTVRFQPWGAYHFFGLPVSEFADRQIHPEHLWGPAAFELEERLATAAGARERVALVEKFLLAQLQRHHKADIAPFVRAIWSLKGRISMRTLCRNLGVGERWLQRTFATALGTSPKRFARLSRFLHACSVLRGTTRPGLTEIGLECGYYDQSHFIAEFKTFSGLTPRQFVGADKVGFLELD